MWTFCSVIFPWSSFGFLGSFTTRLIAFIKFSLSPHHHFHNRSFICWQELIVMSSEQRVRFTHFSFQQAFIVSNTVLGARDTTVNKIESVCALEELTFYWILKLLRLWNGPGSPELSDHIIQNFHYYTLWIVIVSGWKPEVKVMTAKLRLHAHLSN